MPAMIQWVINTKKQWKTMKSLMENNRTSKKLLAASWMIWLWVSKIMQVYKKEVIMRRAIEAQL